MRGVVFGIDGLTMKIMNPLMTKGILPNFSNLLKESVLLKMEGTIPPLTPPGWASIYTGKNPGKHGLLEFRKRNGYHYTVNTRWDCQEAPPFWKYLTDAGKQCTLLNIPMYYPPLPLENCFSISGFTAPETAAVFHPAQLKDEVMRVVPNYRVESALGHRPPQDAMEEHLESNLRVTAARIKIFNYLLETKKWDLFFPVFTSADRLQHFFWDDILNGDPKVISYYKMLDDALGTIQNCLSDQDFLFIVSDHGFGKVEKSINLNTVLELNGFLKLNQKLELPINYLKIRSKLFQMGIGDKLQAILPHRLVATAQRHMKVDAAVSFSKIDFKETKAFTSSGLYGGISINLSGKETGGIVDKMDYPGIRDEVARVFDTLIDPTTGKRVIQRVYRREEIYSGRYTESMPDLMLLAEEGYVFSEVVGEQNIFDVPKGGKGKAILRGNHELETVLIVRGKTDLVLPDQVTVMDIAPTILHLFDIPIPITMDGKPLSIKNTEPCYLDETSGVVFKKSPKRSKIKDRLKGLQLEAN